jgi:pilus assembly protein CpaE
VIRVLIVDDVVEIRQNIKKLLNFEDNIEIAGEAGSGDEAIDFISSARADIILMDINMPGMDGILATEKISVMAPSCAVIMMSVQEEQEYLRKAMMAGARDFLVKPFSNDELVNTIIKVHEKQLQLLKYTSASDAVRKSQGKVITFFSPKGGVGKTTLAVNTAVAIADITKKKVCIVDLDLQFGDVAILLNIPMNSTISDLIDASSNPLDFDDVKSYGHKHSSGVKCYLACAKPYFAEKVKTDSIKQLLHALKEQFDYIIVDTASGFRDMELTAIDICDVVAVIVTLELSTIKSIKLSLEVFDNMLKYGPDKVKLILNKNSPSMGISPRDVIGNLKKELQILIPEDHAAATGAQNRGEPFYLDRNNPDSPVRKAVINLAFELITPEDRNQFKKEIPKDSGFKSFFKGILKG